MNKSNKQKCYDFVSGEGADGIDFSRLGNVHQIVVVHGQCHKYAYIRHGSDSNNMWAVFVDDIDCLHDFDSIEQAIISGVAIAFGNRSKAEECCDKAILGL